MIKNTDKIVKKLTLIKMNLIRRNIRFFISIYVIKFIYIVIKIRIMYFKIQKYAIIKWYMFKYFLSEERCY